MSPEEQAECKLMKENWENWDNLSDEAKKECISKIKSHMDAKEAEMKAQKEMMEAKKLEMDAKWADFDNLSLVSRTSPPSKLIVMADFRSAYDWFSVS